MNVGDQFRRAISWARGVQSGPKPPSSAKVRWHFSPPLGVNSMWEKWLWKRPARSGPIVLFGFDGALIPGIQMAEVDAGEQPLVQGAQLQHLVQVPQLIDLAHGLRAQGDVGKPLAVTGPDHLGQGFEGDLLGLPPGPLHQGPGVDHHPLRPHPGGRLTGGGDIPDGLLDGLRVRVGQVDEVGGVERQGDPRRSGVLPQLPAGLLPHVAPLATLVLIAVQAKLRDPLGGGQRGFVDVGKALRVARRAELCAHKNLLPRPRRRKGVSTA